tara:strand:- start:348 stop:764 length:417 start_codon:yes stop_codon:yes gene_type:complete
MEPEKDLLKLEQKRALPRSVRGGGADSNRGHVTSTDSTQRREENGQANLAEWIVNHPQRIPTPTNQDSKNCTLPPSQKDRDSIPGWLLSNTPTKSAGGSLNPTWVEWLMGWPIGWTDSRPLATDRFPQWLLSHGKYCT